MMRTPICKSRRQAAFTFIELLVATAIVAIASGGLYLALTASLILYAKNTSLNVAHQQLLQSYTRIQKDVHSSLAIPQLLNADLTPYTGTGSAAGVAVQCYSMGPFNVSFAISGSTSVTVATGSVRRPSVGQRIIFQDKWIEKDITAVTPSGANSIVTMASGSWAPINMTDLATIANKVGYVVWKPTPVDVTKADGELRYYPSLAGAYRVLARGLRTATPFSFDTDVSSGFADPRTLVATLEISDPTYNKRGYKTMDLSMTFRVPYRGRIAYFP